MQYRSARWIATLTAAAVLAGAALSPLGALQPPPGLPPDIVNLLSAIAGPGGLDSLMAQYGPLIRQHADLIQQFAQQYAGLIQQYTQQCASAIQALQEMPDPLHSSIIQLVQRPDVQSHLGLSMRKKRELEELQSRAQAEYQRFQQSHGQIGDLHDASDEERQQAQLLMQRQGEKFLMDFQEELDKAIQGILTPEQYKRVVQLDLQWRTALALADPKVAGPMQLTDVKVSPGSLTGR
jgi:hypothetical protein